MKALVLLGLALVVSACSSRDSGSEPLMGRAVGTRPEAKVVVHRVGCTRCHDTSRALVGPSFDEIGRRYASEPGAAERLQKSILHGSAGKWGSVMSPQPGVEKAQARELAEWILKRIPQGGAR